MKDINKTLAELENERQRAQELTNKTDREFWAYSICSDTLQQVAPHLPSEIAVEVMDIVGLVANSLNKSQGE